ncbi:MAG: SAM-dependent methyltransferase, partial [Fimbriimonadales bacterium]
MARSSASLESRVYSRALGHVPTPMPIVQWMTQLAAPPAHTPCTVLEPACSDAPFLREFQRAYGNHHRLVGIEINPQTPPPPHIQPIYADFLLWDT